MQLEVEISKFDTHNESESIEEKFHSQLRKNIIGPYSDKLQTLLNDLFVELNIDDMLLKELKEAKKNKRIKK